MSDLPTRAAERYDQARTHFRAIYGDQAQWIELSAIYGDPDDRQHCRFHQGWFHYTPARLDDLLQQVDKLTTRYGDVYTSVTGYSEATRNKDYALPGRLIFIDDCQPGSYTHTLQTSPDREQAFIILDQPADVPTREQIARRFSRSADKSGWDITQLARVPGTLNTKRRAGGRYGRGPRDWEKGTGHRVTLIPRTLRTYTLTELDQRAPKIAPREDANSESADLHWPEVEQWLGRAGALMDEQNIPRRFKPHQQSYRVLTGEVIPCNSQGLADESTKRAFLARGLCWARYPDDTAAAILWKHPVPEYIARKGTEWHKGDIARIIAKERAIVAAQVADYTIRPITAAELSHSKQAALPQSIVSTPARSRARADRPTKFAPAMLFARYQAEPALCELKRKARAAQLEISTATLDRLEDGLEAIGLIQIEAKPGMPGKVILLGGVINIVQPEVLSGVIEAPAPEVASERAQSGENADRRSQCKGETHPPPVAPGPRPRRAALVAEAFDALDGCKRLTDKRIRQYLEMNYPEITISPALLYQLATNERANRRYARQDAKEIAKARAMRFDVLQRTSRALGTQAAAVRKALRDGVQLPDVLKYHIEYADGSKSKEFKTKKPAVVTERFAQYLLHRAGIYAAEEARREQSEQEHIARIGYSLTEQAEMLELVDQVRPELERQKIGRAAPARGVCSPQPCGPQAGTPAGATPAQLMAQRRRRFEAQRQQVPL